MTIDLRNKVVLITGASSGFGQDASRLFAEEGCKVVLAARRLERLQELASRIQDRGGEAIAVPADVTNRDEINVMVKSAIDLYGQIDILFNNAGFGRLSWLERLDPDRDIETQIQVNLTGLIQTTRAVLPYMLQRRSGHIINMSSVAGWIAPSTYSIYSAAKFGVRGFTDALRREVQPFGIRVSGIYPGPARTEFGQHTGNHPMKHSVLRKYFRSMTSEYVAQRVVDLARRPRRAVIIPWYYRIALFADRTMPWLVDWIVIQFLTKKKHRSAAS
ncbi:MAG: SDR family oxidoreductase [Chloroflexi bacterium]|nr:SDR family oxidoreductase [Chloroflexota bacterium]